MPRSTTARHRPTVTPSPDAFTDERLADELLAEAEVAQLLNISRFSLMRWRREAGGGPLPWVQISERRIGYRRGDVRRYQLARRQGALSEQPAGP
jgi:hypothetical protein